MIIPHVSEYIKYLLSYSLQKKKKFAISRSKYTVICLFYGFLMFISYFTINNLNEVVYIFHKKHASNLFPFKFGNEFTMSL